MTNPLLDAFAGNKAAPVKKKEVQNNPLLGAFMGGSPASQRPEKPFMAEGVDKYNLPYYGEGFKGFTKKVFAKIFDPAKLISRPTKEQAQLIEIGAEKAEQGEKKGWQEWVEKWTGISTGDIARSSVALNLATKGTDEEGNVNEEVQFGQTIATGAGVAARGIGQTIATGLDALSLLDKGMRKVHAFNAALDEIGDASTIIPDATRFDEFLPKVFGDTPTAERLGNFLNAAVDTIPAMMAMNLIRAATAGQSMQEKVHTVKSNVRASNMIYTMFWDEAKKAEYFRRVQSGENPDLLMRELENPWVELAGSVLGDPSTYMGMGIIGNIGKAKTPVKLFGKTLYTLPWESVAKIPTFTQLFGIKNIGKARLLASADEINKIADPAVEKAFQALGTAAEETQAITSWRSAVNAVRNQVVKHATEYGFFVHTAEAKAEVTKKTVGTFMQVLTSRFRNTDDVLETFKAFRNVSSADDKVAAQALSHLKEVYGAVPFSDVGMQSMEFMTRLIDEVDIPAMLVKHGNDIPAFVDDAEKILAKTIDDFYPSVDDMAKAAQEIKGLGTKASERQKFLANAFDKLPSNVKWSNSVNTALTGNKAYRGLQSFYSGVLMGMRPAYAVRNLLQNTFTIWHDLGARAGIESLFTGAEVFVKSAAGKVAKQDWVTGVLEREGKAIEKVLGFIPTEALKGTGSAGQTGFGFLEVGQDIEKVHSAIVTRYVVEAEMEKALRYGGIPAIDGLPKEMAESLTAHAMETYGNVSETMKRFRADQATGFYETWRHLELDPAFKDTMRRAGLLDELDDIRKLSPDPVAFSDAMDAFVNKIEDLAKQTANEPALVSADNPLSDVVVTIEKAFEEGGRKGMSEDELNQFRALTEARDQLRNVFQDYVDVMRDRVGRLIPPEQMKPFEQRFSGLREALSGGASKWRGYADEIYNGIYKQSKSGTPPSQLWGQVRSVMLDMQDGKPVLRKISLADTYPNIKPEDLSKEDFNGLLWRWFKDRQSEFWASYTKEFMVGQDNIIDEMAKMAGVNLDEVKLAEYGDLAKNPRITQISDLTQQIQDWESYLDLKTMRKSGEKGETLAAMIAKDFPNWRGGKTHLFNAVNAERAAVGVSPYAAIDEVPFEEAINALAKRERPMPPYVGTTQPTVTRQLLENLNGGLRDAIQEFKNGTLEKWGEKTPMDSKLSDEMEDILSAWVKEADRRSVSNRAAAATIANETRNFILHDYNKTYGDKFASYMLMYAYWPSHTYARWGERIVEAPGVVSTYAKWRATMEKVHSDQPEFYRYNLPIGKLPGMNNSPMYFNLESTLNPLNSLIGTDFNDPKRRVDWLSSAVDDMGKFGFNLAMPLQWAMAFNLYKKNEDEAARRWLGRAIPATQDLKAGLNLLKDKTGVDLMPDIGILPGAKYGEFDPFINAQGGLDAYEEKRVGRALQAMIDSGEVTREEALDIMYKREGAAYDEAVHRAINERAPGQMASYFAGTGFKTRTEGDLRVEAFYNQYYKLLSMRENLNPEDYKRQLNALQSEFTFADTVLLAARGGDDRDAMYAYNVLSRIPPGDSTEILRSMGLNEELISKFYEDKGDFSEWTEQDKDRFMSAMLDIGATYKLPDEATRNEWNDAKDTYKDVQEEISDLVGLPYEGSGRGVWDVVSTYNDLKDTNKDQADIFKEQHPEINEALFLLGEAKISDPVLAKYYASLDTVEAYYAGRIRAELAEKYGADITRKQTEYYNARVESTAAGKAYLKQNLELISYWRDKKRLEQGMDEKIIEIAASLPPAAPGAQLRDEFTPENATQELLASFAGQQTKTWAEVSMPMSTPLQNKIQKFWMDGTPLNNAALKELDYIARTQGYYNAEDLLREAGYAFLTQQGQAQESQPAANNPLLQAFAP